MKTKFSKYSLIAFAAGALGFISTFAQLFLVREFLVVFYGNELVIGIILFSWIFLSGVGSYVAISLEKCKSRIELVYGGFMALAFFPMLSYVLLAYLSPLFLHQGELAGLSEIAIIAMLVLLPVCLLNGILFSLFSQVFQNSSFISSNYAYESIGGLIGGIVIYFYSGNTFEATDVLFVLGILTIGCGLLLAWNSTIFNRVLKWGIAAFVVLFGLIQTHPDDRIPVNTFGNQSAFFHKGHVKIYFVNSGYLNDVTLMQNYTQLKNMISLQETDINTVLKTSSNSGQLNYRISHSGSTNRILLCLTMLFLGYFIFKLNGVGRSVFITGFSCLALEMVIMVLYQSFCGTIYRGSGIIISTFMAGMAIGFLTKIPKSSNALKWFSTILILLAIICILPLLIITNNSLFSGFYMLTAVVLLFIGFIFSICTGLLFSLSVAIGKGTVGEIVAKTYGADMIGASLGALLVSSFLIPRFGVQTVEGILFLMLFLSGITLKFSK